MNPTELKVNSFFPPLLLPDGYAVVEPPGLGQRDRRRKETQPYLSGGNVGERRAVKGPGNTLLS